MSTRPKTDRQVSSSKPQQPPIQHAPDALIHPTVSFAGKYPITIGSKAIIQLRSRIDSTHAPIHVGSGTIIAERASIGYLSASIPSSITPSPDPSPPSLTISEGVIIETGAVVEAASIGAYTVIEVGAKLGKGAVIGEKCKICAAVEIMPGELVEGGTVVWGGGSWAERRGERDGEGLGDRHVRRVMVEALGEGVRAAWVVK